MSEKNKIQIEFSKQILIYLAFVLLLQFCLYTVLSLMDKDTGLFMASISANFAAITGSAVYYYKKSQQQNLLNIKIAFAKFKIKLSNLLTPDQINQLDLELDHVEDTINNTLNNSLEKAVDDTYSSEQS